ncbi:MAG: hypothetical protein A2887_04570 [Alphaproteobacteria bacterium RIFCSPLOWO2_01_FULL_40_26]|nr:MAG: hypothetical protein A3D15_05795 [Alphaproteobacteria bacterium RIFCSPHIGHO2_02_FULL_40_34]OFW95210.1 MAG: hypothetical protein A2887_04570 [Alphaproteobacteria bacterium RIFCSPLOWO2_01_FULL_40_26]OFX09954.1 MAG: hypothetical protein A3H30_02645 [Alphaproteobacteria bacterium RIFCSPLOWO2_02_FULL_40_19]OFX12351.1 MAG: hypothetical protein A3G22_03675 [Alphaproteobacteria bacterium RIFCSPLOWO2_12_FULL_40_11]
MKKLIFSLVVACVFLPTKSWAIKIDQIAGAVEAVAQSSDKSDGKAGKKSAISFLGVEDEINKVTSKLEEKVNKITDKIENRVEKYEKKLDAYEQKIDKVEKALDRVITTINSLDASQIQKYIAVAKYVAIAVILLLGSFVILLILVFVQLIRVRAMLAKAKI